MTREIEQTLERQTLRQPSAGLDMRVLATIRSGAPERRRGINPRFYALWVTLGAAAAAAVALAAVPMLSRNAGLVQQESEIASSVVAEAPARGPVEAGASSLDGFNPIEIRQTVSRLDPGSLLVADDGKTPMRSVAADRIEKFHWVDTNKHITMELEVPQHDVMLISAPAD